MVVRQGYQADWGFLLFRTDYSDDAAWERYEQEFKRLTDKSVIDDGAESIHDGCMVKMVVDEELEGSRMEDVRQCVAILLQRLINWRLIVLLKTFPRSQGSWRSPSRPRCRNVPSCR